MRGHGCTAGSRRRLKEVGQERTSVKGVGTESLQEARTKYLMQEQGTGIGEWAAEARRRGRRPAQEKRRGQPAMWKRDEGGREKWEGRWIFIALRKAAGEAMQGHLAGWGRTKPNGATLCLEAGRGARFTRTYIIL